MHKKYLLLFFCYYQLHCYIAVPSKMRKLKINLLIQMSMQSINRKWMNIGKHITAKFIMCFITH